MEFAGMWKNVSDKDIKEMKKIIGELRDSSTNQLLENDMS